MESKLDELRHLYKEIKEQGPASQGSAEHETEKHDDKSPLDQEAKDDLVQQVDSLHMTLRDKEDEIDKLVRQRLDTDSRMHKIMADFSQVRAKAQEMLVHKDAEIKRLREKTIGARKEPTPNVNNSGIDSDDDIISQVY